MRTLAVTEAEYAGEHRLQIRFSDGTSQVVDFGPFLQNHPHPQHDKYRRLANFKRFRIERGNVIWGKDWDLTSSGISGSGSILDYSTKEFSPI